ncbi:MAG TPA: DUF4129 domain-containing protein [Streptosporangiaceae bacterium]|jgi:hypothetical protein|nr:DUF4129 domain-containing protein [Streptosporangiaceae bacterium]
MDAPTRAKTAIAAVLALLAIAGARLARPVAGWDWPPHRALVVGCVLEVVLVGLLITLRWGRRRPPAGPPGRPPSDDLAARLRRVVSAALTFAVIAVPVLVVLTSVKFSTRRLVKLPSLHIRPGRARQGHPLPPHLSNFHIGSLLLYVIIAILIAALVVIAVLAWRHHGRLRTHPPDLEIEEISEDKLARAVQSGQLALREFDDARRAIIACYLAMERSLAEAGAARGAAETPDELLDRAVAAGLVPPAPAGRLTALFYGARFSSHPVPAAARDQALAALDEIAAALGASIAAAGESR